MARTVLSRLVGAFLLLYGIGSILMSWWAYSVTHEAFVSVRNFTTLFEQERTKAADALKGASDLVVGDSSAGGSGAGSGGSGSGLGRGLRDGLRGLLGGSQGSSGQSGSSSSSPSTQGSGDGLGLLDQLQQRLGQAGSGWNVLGEGPLRQGLLDQVEFATNAVLAWMVIHGLVSIVVGFFLLLWSPRPAPVAAVYPQAWTQQQSQSAGQVQFQPNPQWPGYPPAAQPQPQPRARPHPQTLPQTPPPTQPRPQPAPPRRPPDETLPG